MKFNSIFWVLFVAVLFTACTKEYDCDDLQVQPVFIHYSLDEVDTFVIRKFKPDDNYQTMIDTMIVSNMSNGLYQVSSDSITVLVIDEFHGIRVGYDWQLFIPAKNKTFFISNIVSEKRIGKTNTGLFSTDASASCTNKIFSLQVNGNLITFPAAEGRYTVDLTN